MIIKLDRRYSDIEISVGYKGSLNVSFNNHISVLNAILEAIYEEIPMEDFIKTLDYEQMKEISKYFETIKDSK